MSNCRNSNSFLRVLTDEFGCTILESRKSKHLFVRVRAPNGREFCSGIPVSSSDHRAILNFRSQTRRKIAGLDGEGRLGAVLSPSSALAL